MPDLCSRTARGLHPQLTTGGWGPYRWAVEATFRDSVDFTQLRKVYGDTVVGRQGYAPPRFVEAVRSFVVGEPERRLYQYFFTLNARTLRSES